MPESPLVPTVIRNALAALPDGLRRVDIGMKCGKIDRISPSLAGYSVELDAGGQTVIPGMLDTHTHGAMGVDCNNASLADLQTLSAFYASEGVTGFWPTLLSDSQSSTLATLRTLTKARGRLPGAQILGCHLEGPFLNPDYRGAMPRRFLREPNAVQITQLLSVAGNCKLRITIAPELPDMKAIIPLLVSQGMQVSLGHSGATYEQTMQALAAGATSFTHVMNAMRPLDRHAPGILGAALESDAYCEFICDGLHLHPANVRLLLKAKGLARMVAVSDSIMATGLGNGAYRLGAQHIVVKNGDAMLRNGITRAGSLLTLRKALINLMHFTDLPLEKAILPVAGNPADMLGLPKGRIAVGMDADLVVLNTWMNVEYTVVGQKIVYRRGEK